MAAVPPPPGHTFPVPTDGVLVGYGDPSWSHVRALRRDAVVTLIPYDVQQNQDDGTGNMVLVNIYSVVASDIVPNGVVVAAFDDPGERRAWLIANATAWLSAA